MASKPQSAHVQAMLARFTAWGQVREDVHALILTSSFTTDKAPVDALSDYDLIIFVASDIQPYFDDRAWLDDFGPVLVVYRDPIETVEGLSKTCFVTQYENGLKIDFIIRPIEYLRRMAAAAKLSEEFDAGYQVLLDKDNLTQTLPLPTYHGYIPPPPSQADYHGLIHNFFHETTYVAKYLWRDDLVAAKFMLDGSIKPHDLATMLVWRSEIDHGWTIKPGPYGRRIKQWLRADVWQALENTYVGADLAANWAALFQTIALFRQAAIEVGDLLGYAYLHDLDRRMMIYLDKVHHLPRDATTFSE